MLLIACANVANLLLVQNAARDREIAVRTALGATRGQLVRQLLAEAMILAAAGGVMGLVVAYWALDLALSMAPSSMRFLSAENIALDRRGLAFAFALTAITGVLCGIMPALKGSKQLPQDALKSGARTATGGPRQERLRRTFVVAQLAVSVVLLVGAALLIRTFVRLMQVDPGFDARNLAIVQLELPAWKYPNREARLTFYDTLLDRVRALPGVAGAIRSGGAPPDGGDIKIGLTVEVEGRGVVLEDQKLLVPYSSVGEDYFSFMKIPLKAGRVFSADDTGGAPRAIIINQSMAARIWNRDNPVGQRMRIGTGASDPWLVVVGVVGDVYQFDYAQPRGQLGYYFPRSQTGTGSFQVLTVRTAEDPAKFLPLLRTRSAASIRISRFGSSRLSRARTGVLRTAPLLYGASLDVGVSRDCHRGGWTVWRPGVRDRAAHAGVWYSPRARRSDDRCDTAGVQRRCDRHGVRVGSGRRRQLLRHARTGLAAR